MLILRSLVFNAFLYVFTALCSVIAATLGVVSPRRLPGFSRGWSKSWLAVYKAICGVSYVVQGAEHLPSGGYVIAMKHQSTWDTFAMFAIFPEPVFVFKGELAKIPFFGLALVRLGCVPINRSAGRAALDAMAQGTAAACAKGKQVVIFPEGTRSSLGAAPNYKTGVSHIYATLGLPCVPVALNSGLLWPRHRFLRPPGVITLEILPVIPKGLERKEMHQSMANQIESASNRLAALH